MLHDIEKFASPTSLYLRGEERFTYAPEHPHISQFRYDLFSIDREGQEAHAGVIDGYRIAQDWSVGHELALWDEADAFDADVVTYVDALIRELRACAEVFDYTPDLTFPQRVTIVRHFESLDGSDAADLMRDASALLVLKDAPALMLIDPHLLPNERRSAEGKLKARSRITKLLELGFVRMVGSRFLWGWNRELAQASMEHYSYRVLFEAKRRGRLRDIFGEDTGSGLLPSPTETGTKVLGFPDPEETLQD
ncbi:MAG: hypothetical protein ABW321_36115 [Polyangiales bacterium]